MKKLTILVLLLMIVTFAISAQAQGPTAKDVNVVNTPNVTVTNPTTAVTVNNDTSSPVPVDVKNTPNVTVTNPTTAITVDNDTSSPVPVDVVSSGGVAEYRFVGFSNASHSGGVGLNALYASCQDDFDLDARMCTSKEIFRSPEIGAYPFDPYVVGWTRPVIEVAVFDATKTVFYDASGYEFKDCLRWLSSAGVQGLVFGKVAGPQIIFDLAPCSQPFPVACCAPR